MQSGVEIAEEEAKDKVWSEVISWIEQGHVSEKNETRGKARDVLVTCSMFDPEVFKMKNGVLMFTNATNKNRIGEVWRICLPSQFFFKKIIFNKIFLTKNKFFGKKIVEN